MGCSTDTLLAQHAFADKLGLRYPLLADAEGAVAGAYGVMHEKWPVAARNTVVVAADGTVEHVYAQVQSKGHAEQVLEDLRAADAEGS